MKLARKIDESASDVVGYGMVTRCHQRCGGAQRSVHRQSGGHSCCAWKMVMRSQYVFLKEVLATFSRRPYGRIRVACVGTLAQQLQEERERCDTRGHTANSDHTGGVEGLSGPHRGRVPQTRRPKKLSAKDSGEQKVHEKRTNSFHDVLRTRTPDYSQQAEAREMYAAECR